MCERVCRVIFMEIREVYQAHAKVRGEFFFIVVIMAIDGNFIAIQSIGIPLTDRIFVPFTVIHFIKRCLSPDSSGNNQSFNLSIIGRNELNQIFY
jgi:hypothetical protein